MRLSRTRVRSFFFAVMACALTGYPLEAEARQVQLTRACQLDIPAATYGRSPNELHRILIRDVAGSEICGSRDGGRSWVYLGKVTKPFEGGVWTPTVGSGVLAFNFLRGPSNVFSSAVNAIHLRFSDPEGYRLPEDLDAPLVTPRAVSLMPNTISTVSGSTGDMSRVAITDIAPGTSIFGATWSPKVGSRLLYGNGSRFVPLPYEDGAPNEWDVYKRYLLIITDKSPDIVEYIEFENSIGGKVSLKTAGREAQQVAKVVKPLGGHGDFTGSEFVPKPGAIRANHPGVFEIGTTDYLSNPAVPRNIRAADRRGAFQIVPSHHYNDPSLTNPRRFVPQIYMVVGPIIDPPDLRRYDRGVEGTYPLFKGVLRAGTGKTWFKFEGDEAWYEIPEALARGKFKHADGTPMKHLRGIVLDSMTGVTKIRYAPNAEQ